MKKYYIGLFILALVTFGVVGYVLTLGIQSRQDVKTEKSAQDVADKLNNYINTKQQIPTSLAEVGAKDVPESIKYTKISEKNYKICVTYRASKGYGSSDITTVLTGAAMSRAYGSAGTTGYNDNPSNYEPSSLYINSTHKKGEDCQTIKPYISSYNSYNGSGSSSGSTIDEFCNPKGKYYETYKTYCTPATTPKTTVQ